MQGIGVLGVALERPIVGPVGGWTSTDRAGRGGFRWWAGGVHAAPEGEGTGAGVKGGFPARRAPRRGGGWKWQGLEGHGGWGGARGFLDESYEVCPQVAGAFRRALAEEEESPLPVTEGASVKVGRKEAALRGGPETRP